MQVIVTVVTVTLPQNWCSSSARGSLQNVTLYKYIYTEIGLADPSHDLGE